MSIQFRTRSQTVVDYSEFINGNGSEPSGCCYVYNSGTNTVTNSSKTISECNQLNGYFLNGECDSNITITPSTKGCCCACKNYSDSLGASYLKNTTFCECQDLSGLWSSGSCPETETSELLNSLCISAPPKRIDHREKRACCHPEFTTDGVVATCTDVCTEKECAEKAIYPYSATFYKNGRKCFETIGDASPATNECSLSTTFQGKVINSCVNGTNIYSWNLANFTNDTNKHWYDSRLPGKFIKSTNQTVFWLETDENYNVLLGPTIVKNITSAPNEAKSIQDNNIKKLCPGGYALNYNVSEPNRWFDGYFAIIDSQNNPSYYSSSTFSESLSQDFSPIPPSNEIVPVIDLIATRTFSAFITENNTLKIFGRFFDADINEYRVLNVTDKLKKIYQHNLEVNPKQLSGTCYSLSTVGFVGQKLDGKFEYYSPFISQSSELQQIQNMIRSMPPKNYVEASLGAYTFCGIDSEGIMTCVSLNSEIQVPLDKRFKLVSCSNQNQQTDAAGGDPMKDFCYAVDTGNRIIRLSSTDEYFDLETEPKYSTTDVRSLSCYYGFCDIVVEPDVAICNSQMLGSCCTCVDGVAKCSSPITQGECTGWFTSGGICCTDNQTDNCQSCSEIENICNENSSNFLRITQAQTDLPVDELTYYKDGLYVGIFEPGVPVNVSGSTVRGNPITGIGTEYKPKVIGYGSSSKKWAIIVSPTEYEFDSINDATEFIENIPASLYDGRWNTYGDLDNYFGIQSKSMETLRNDSRLSGWYLPSKNELEFINYKMNHGFMIPELFKSFENGLYLSSTPYFEYRSDSVYNIDVQKFGSNGFMYGQSFSKLDYGSIYLVPRTKKVNVRLIKRIDLE